MNVKVDRMEGWIDRTPYGRHLLPLLHSTLVDLSYLPPDIGKPTPPSALWRHWHTIKSRAGERHLRVPAEHIRRNANPGLESISVIATVLIPRKPGMRGGYRRGLPGPSWSRFHFY